VHVSQLSDNFVKDPADVVKPGQKVHVTVTEIDLPRNRIALSMKANPNIGTKTPAQGAGRGPAGSGGFRSAAVPAKPVAPTNLGGDWFSAALNKKR
jgi:uncharacterized protein